MQLQNILIIFAKRNATTKYYFNFAERRLFSFQFLLLSIQISDNFKYKLDYKMFRSWCIWDSNPGCRRCS